jgi:hypothetical protein
MVLTQRSRKSHQPSWKHAPKYPYLFHSRPETRSDVYATFLDYLLVVNGKTYNDVSAENIYAQNARKIDSHL